MVGFRWQKRTLFYSQLLVGLIVLFSLHGGAVALAQSDFIYLREVRAIDTNDLGLLNPAGLAYSFAADLFFVLEAQSTTQANIATMTPFESLLASDGIDISSIDPINLTFDDLFDRLLLLDSATNELVEIKSNLDGRLDPAAITRYQLGSLSLQKPRGMIVDPENGQLLILDSAAQQIVRLEPEPDGSFRGAMTPSIDLTTVGLVDPQGLAWNPNNSHLYFLNGVGHEVYELNETGRVVAILHLPPSEFVDPQGLVFAFSGDATDDPEIINLYIADTGLGSGYLPGQALGRIMEMALPVVYVPQDVPTIQGGIDRAGENDLVLVAPGTYFENLQLADKSITLASYFHIDYPNLSDRIFIIERNVIKNNALVGLGVWIMAR